jgi:hypothetical protein
MGPGSPGSKTRSSGAATSSGAPQASASAAAVACFFAGAAAESVGGRAAGAAALQWRRSLLLPVARPLVEHGPAAVRGERCDTCGGVAATPGTR